MITRDDRVGPASGGAGATKRAKTKTEKKKKKKNKDKNNKDKNNKESKDKDNKDKGNKDKITNYIRYSSQKIDLNNANISHDYFMLSYKDR